MKTIISIIIVNYKLEKELFDCVGSIKKSKPKVKYEIIVVDNFEDSKIQSALSKKFPQVKYIKAKKNLGFGGGNNLGASFAKGEYLFFLNPDTKVYLKTIDNLYTFMQKNKKAGVTAPLLIDPQGKTYDLQGTKTLTPKNALFGLSFLNKIFPNNIMSKDYWMKDWDKSKIKEADVVPGTAFMIKKKLFEQIGKFDENFFLYFEEFDLCKRVKELGYKLFIIPQSKVMHIWGASTKKSKDNINKIFRQSRFYYFKKHYGVLNAFLTESFLRITKEDFLFTIILGFGIFLRLFDVNKNISFYSEVGDNLLDIKNAYLGHYLPLLGPPTSHPWLYFGPLFYWIYGPILILSKFNPLSHQYFGAFISISIIIVNYVVIKNIFNKKIALISSFLITISPLYLIANTVSRFIYLVPLFIYPFIYLLYKILSEHKKYFFWLALTLGVMLNFHYTPLILIPFVVIAFLIKKIALTKKTFVKLFVGFTIPQLPLIFYNFLHKFEMLKNFFLWIPYKILVFLHLYHEINPTVAVADKNNVSFISFFVTSFSPFQYKYFDVPGIIISIVLFIYVFKKAIEFWRKKSLNLWWLIIFLWGGMGLLAILIQSSPPLHYFVPLFPLPILIFSLFLFDVWQKKNGKYLVVLSLLFLFVINCLYFFSNRWFFQDGFINYKVKEKIAKFIVNDAHGKKYVLHRVGYNDKLPNEFAQDYVYLLWLYGNEPAKKANLQYVVYEPSAKIPKTIGPNEKLFLIAPQVGIIKEF